MTAGAPALPSVAIIVPVYDVEKYLPECLDSIRAQDYAGWRATVVIDGSPDGSEAIARRYAEEDDRFDVVSVPNGGLGSARNVGLSHSVGDYVFFVDSDDTVPPGTISALVDAAERTGSDIVAGYAEDFGESWIPSRYWTQRGALFRGDEITTTVAQTPEVLDDHVVWNKLYRRGHLERNGLGFPPRVHCEDMVFSARGALTASSVTILPRLVYRHRRHDGAISASYTRAKTLGDWLGQSTRTIEQIAELGSAGALRHYLVHFVKGQWWTRARGIHEIAVDAMVSRLQQLSLLIRDLLDDEGAAQLGPWFRRCLDVFVDGEPRLLADLGEGRPSALAEDAGESEDVAMAILDVAEALAADGRVSVAMADALVVERVLRRIADGCHATDGDVARRALALHRTLDDGYLADVAKGSSYDARVATFLREQGRMTVDIRSVRREERGVVLRGTLRPSAGAHEASTMSAVVIDVDRGTRAFAPVTWTTLSDDVLWRWQAVLPPELVEPGRSYRIEIKAEADGAQLGRGTAQPVPEQLREVVAAGDALTFPREFFLTGGQDRRLFAFPAWRDNPYVIALQLELFSRRFGIGGTSDLGAFVAEATDPLRSGVIHVQWPSVVTDAARSEADAERRVDEFTGALRTAKVLGRPIVWTVHNVLPHDTEYVDQAERLHTELAEAADVVHVLNSRTVDVASEHYRIDPAKVVVIPHASYAGVYGPPVARAEARETIGARPDTTGVLFFGQLRPYKGLDQLVAAMTSLAEKRDDLELLLAGKPFEGLDAVLDEVDASGIANTRSIGFVPDGDVPTWLSAADVLVLPHRKVLNSGTLYLGATYGVPTILPDEPHLRADFGDEAWVRFFDPEDPAASIAALIDDDWHAQPAAREAALAFARRNPPIAMSRRFAAVVEALHAGERVPGLA